MTAAVEMGEGGRMRGPDAPDEGRFVAAPAGTVVGIASGEKRRSEAHAASAQVVISYAALPRLGRGI